VNGTSAVRFAHRLALGNPPIQADRKPLAGVKESIEAAGARLLYLPPYSPDLNPIELAFSKMKAH
jgi:transposase